jgi:multidrug efflux system membrane fusion protein
MSARLEHGAEPVHRRGARSRRLYLVLGGLAAFALLLVFWSVFRPRSVSAAAPHAVAVTAATVTIRDVPLSITALGAAQAWTSDTILAQVSGKLLRVNFIEGSDVRAGQVLAEIDPAPYQAALVEAEGTLTRDSAALAGARRDLERYQHLVADNAIARQTAEDQAALVAQDEGVVEFDRGQVAVARINLGYCRIVSPISGRAGVRLVDPGNLVSASGSVASTPNTASATSAAAPTSSVATSASGATSGGASSSGSGIVVINQVEPIAVTFTVPEGEFQRLVDASDRFRKALAVQASSQETGQLLGAGELSIADNRVDPSTGTVELKAQLPNSDGRLWPGQFVNVRLTLQTLPAAIALPLAAVNRGPRGQFAFVVTSDNHVVARPIAVAWTQGQLAVAASGLRPGERVVTDGQMTLRDGTLVRIARTAPPASPDP